MWQIFKSILVAVAYPCASQNDRAFHERVAKAIRRIDWSNLDETVTSLCHLYSRANAPHQEHIRNLVSPVLAEKLLAFADAKASRLLQGGMEDDLKLALIALAIESQKAEDFRNVLAHLAKLNHAARKSGISVDTHIVAASDFCSTSTADLFREFVRREDRLKDIQAFGFEERDGRFAWRG
jgi:hypothetical protein